MINRDVAAPSRSVAVTAPRLCPEAAFTANWLNAFRLGFAVLVLFSHCFVLTRGSNRTDLLYRLSGNLTLGELAVNGFFLISGFLIVRSWLRAESMAVYFQHRVLRIHPGFVVALAVSLALAAVSCASPLAYLRALSWRQLLCSAFTLKYGILDATHLEYPGNPYLGTNASLWTIPLEFMAYIGVAAYGLFGLFRHRRLWLALAGAILAVYLAKIWRDGQADAWWRFASYFAGGATFYLFRDVLRRSRLMLLAAISLLAAGLVYPAWFNAVGPLAGGWLLFHVAFLPIPPNVARRFRTDLSYGVYLYAYPIQQSLVHWFSIRNPALLFLLALPITLAAAWLSWTLVERRFLALKQRTFSDSDPAARR